MLTHTTSSKDYQNWNQCMFQLPVEQVSTCQHRLEGTRHDTETSNTVQALNVVSTTG
jgi:hypothetical protein